MDVRLGSPVPVPVTMSMSRTGVPDGGEQKKIPLGREIFVPRILGAIFWNVALQCLFVSFLIFILNVDLFHPHKWIHQTSKAVSSLGIWFNLIPIAVLTFAEGVLMSRDYVKGLPCVKTRFGVLCTVFQPRCISMAVVSMLSGAAVVLYYSSLLGEGAAILTKSCDSPVKKCLNERNVFLIVGGLWVGLYSCLKRHMWETHVLIFPLVHQLRYPQFKNQLGRVISQSVREAIPPVGYLLLIYAWVEGFLREHLSGFLSVAVDEDPLNSLWAWIHLSLIVRSFLFSFVTILSVRTMELLFQIFLTEPCYFPISKISVDILTMREALASPFPLLQQLGYLDVLHVAERDPMRRGELFSLSLPGGHPHNWNGVISELLKALGSFTTELNSAASDMNRATNGPLLSTPTPKADPQPRYTTSLLSSPLVTSGPSPSQSSPTGLRMRNMSLLQSSDMNGSFIAYSPTSQIITADQRKSASEAIKVQVWNCLEWVRRKPGINLFFGEIEDARARYLLLHSQHLAWATQALALLASASLTKDAYGVVQKDIPSIIKAFLNLKNALDRLPLYSHKRALRHDSLDIRMKAALTSSVKRSLYILCEAFGQYLCELSIPEDMIQQLSGFVAFKEG